MKGLSVIVKNELEFNRIKEFLGDDVLYLGWVKQMGVVETAIVIWYDDEEFLSVGSVGSSEYQKSVGIRCVEFSKYFKHEN